jgi:hypothetical protein
MSFEVKITEILPSWGGLPSDFNTAGSRHSIPHIFEHEVKRLLPDANSFGNVLGSLAQDKSITVHPSYFLAKPYILLSLAMDTVDDIGNPTGLIAGNNMQYRVRMAYYPDGSFQNAQANMKDLMGEDARREFEATIDCDSPGCKAIDSGLPELLKRYDTEGVLPSFLYENNLAGTPLAVSALCMTKRTQIYLFHALSRDKGRVTSGIVYEVCADTSYFASPDAKYITGHDHELELEAKEIFCTAYAPTDEQKIEMLEKSARQLGSIIQRIERRAKPSPLSKLQRANEALSDLVKNGIYSENFGHNNPPLANISAPVFQALSFNLSPSQILHHHKLDLTHLIRKVEGCPALIGPELLLKAA